MSCIIFVSCTAQTQNESGVSQQSVFYYLWIISALISTCYTLAWDIKMDWGLFDKNAGENRFLREELVYSHKVCVCNVIC